MVWKSEQSRSSRVADVDVDDYDKLAMRKIPEPEGGRWKDDEADDELLGDWTLRSANLSFTDSGKHRLNLSCLSGSDAPHRQRASLTCFVSVIHCLLQLQGDTVISYISPTATILSLELFCTLYIYRAFSISAAVNEFVISKISGARSSLPNLL